MKNISLLEHQSYDSCIISGNKIDTQVFACRINDPNSLFKSSSGGAFTAITDYFLKNGYVIITSIYNYESHTEEFQLVQTKTERDTARGSKYMQSNPGEIFRKAAKWIKENPDTKILFVGMGCQAEGFRKFAEIKGFRDHVYVVDIVCHGSPSPKLWKEYAESLERKKQGKITYLTFKDKRMGWQHPTAYVIINNKEVFIDDYVKLFYNRCVLRPSCHVCPFATTERKTDITIGDFWHIEKTIPDFYDPNGTSLFLIHTDRGEKLFEELKDSMEYRESNTEQCWQANLEAPTPASEQRSEFWNDYQRNGIDFVMKKYGRTSIQSKIINKIKKLIGGGY